MSTRELTKDIQIKGVSFRVYYTIENNEAVFNRMYKLPMLKLLKENKDGDFVINIHDGTSQILVLRKTILEKIKED
ncbi:MAG: hypothetical protein ACRC41_11150 [Sarcina sp.]